MKSLPYKMTAHKARARVHRMARQEAAVYRQSGAAAASQNAVTAARATAHMAAGHRADVARTVSRETGTGKEGRRAQGAKAARRQAGMKAAHREKGEEGLLKRAIRKISRIIGLIPIILKVIEVAVDSIQIARRNLKEN